MVIRFAGISLQTLVFDQMVVLHEKASCYNSSGEHEYLYKMQWLFIQSLLRYFSWDPSGIPTSKETHWHP